MPERDEDERGQHDAQVGRVGCEAQAERQHAERRQGRTADEQRARADPAEQLRADPGRDADAQRHRQEGEAGPDGGVAVDLLHPQDHEEEHGEDAGADEQGAEVGPEQRLGAEQPEVDERLRGPALHHDEAGEQDHGQDEREDRLGGAPAEVVALDQRVDQRDEAARDEQRAGDVEAAGALVPALRHEAQGADDGEHGDRHVHEQHPAPGRVLGQDAAQDETDGRAAGGDGRPDAERAVALRALREDDGQQGQRRGGHERAAQALHEAGDDEQAQVAGEPAEQGGDREQHGAEQEHLAPAEPVGQLAAEQQEAAEGEGVAGDDPRQVVLALHLEGAGDVGQRDVHDRGVEHDHELADGEHEQGEALADLASVRVDERFRPGVRCGGGHAGCS
jgi:hypothetical protein